MSQQGEADPVRRRAGLLSSLVKLYVSVKELTDEDGSTEDAAKLQEKLSERYVAYLDSHELSLATYPDREDNLMASHIKYELQHRRIVKDLQLYIENGTKPEDDIESLHAASLFSLRSQKSERSRRASIHPSNRSRASQSHSHRPSLKHGEDDTSQHAPSKSDRDSVSHRSQPPPSKRDTASHVSQAPSERLSEIRVQAELAKRQLEQEQMTQHANQLKLDMERRAAQQRRDLDEMDAKAEQQQRELAARRKELEEETERRAREFENAMQLQQAKDRLKSLQTEVHVRQREEMRQVLGSDYDSEEERDDDVTKPKRRNYQTFDEQTDCMKNILEDFTKQREEAQEQDSTGGVKVLQWLEDAGKTKRAIAPQVPLNTPANFNQRGYRPTAQDFAPWYGPERATQNNEKEVTLNSRQRPETFSTTHDRNRSDAALFGQALLENRLPKPKILTFDGDSKRYKMFMASFLTNVDKILGADDDQMKLTLLLQQCTGKALDLIEDCVMLSPERGYAKALEKLERRFGKSHQIARSYIDGVKTGGIVKLNDVEALVQLADDMEKCQTVLSELNFKSDLDSTGTIESILARLPDSFQTKWVSRSVKILNQGREPTFADLTMFVVERAEEYSSKYGQSFAERKLSSSKAKTNDTYTNNKPNQKKRNITTFAASTSTGQPSTAGLSKNEATSTSSSSNKPMCLECGKTGHFIARCIRFKKMSLEDKRSAVKKHNLCFCCLKQGHGSAQCERTCPICQKKHHYHLHEDSTSKHDDKKTAASTDVVSLSTFKPNGRASLGVLKVRVQANGKESQCLALVDSGCNQTLLRRRVADELGIKGSPYVYTMNTMNGKASHNEIRCEFTVTAEDETGTVTVEDALTIPSISIYARYDGTAHEKWPHLSDLRFPKLSGEVDLIIGTDCTDMFWTLQERRGGRKEPIARRTQLGWILLGPTDGTVSANSAGVEPIQFAFDKMLMADFEDVRINEPVMSVDDRRALKTMEDTIHMKDGKFHVGIPWKVNPEEALQNNRSMAESRLRMLRRKLDSNPRLADDYTKTVEGYISDGHAMLVEGDELNEVHQWYLPHHAVFKRSNPEKCRVVFDCAAQFKGISLNDAIHQGPNFLNNLAGVLIRFRKEAVAVVGDIKLMFHQCFVLPKDRRFLRFLWWPGGDTTEKPRVYAMKVHLFGGKSSPSVVNFCMRKIADDNESKFPEIAVTAMRRSFYMDDLICSVSSENLAKKLIHEMQKLLKAGGFDLAKFMSTSRDVIETVKPEQRAKSIQDVDLNDSTLPQESTLGLKWNVEGDFFTYAFHVEEKPLTKRGLLATTASLYDPLGLVAPVVLVPKLLQQELCRLELDWDDAIPVEKSAEFQKWREQTKALSNLQIPRCFQRGSHGPIHRELHIFTDASEKAYGAAAYLKVTANSSVTVSLVMGKSRVAPLKSISIPRLELTAATVGAKLSKFLIDELDCDKLTSYFWTDSMTVLRYLRNVSTRFKIFVAHRVQQIQEVTDIHTWNYVPTDQNPADLASRGIHPNDEQRLQFWLQGPAFLRENTQYTRLFEEPSEQNADLEIRAACANEVAVDLNVLINHYSSLPRLQRAVVWLIKLATFIHGKAPSKEISVDEMDRAMMSVVRFVPTTSLPKRVRLTGQESRSCSIQQANALQSHLA